MLNAPLNSSYGDITLSIVTRNQGDYLNNFLTCYRDEGLSKKLKIPLLIINDGSTDNTQLIINNFIKEHTELSYIQTAPSGVASARNTALEHCKTRWLAFTDTDCTLSSEYFQLLINIPAEFDNAIAIEGAILTPVAAVKPFIYHIVESTMGGMYATANMIFNAKKVLALGGFDCNFGSAKREDTDLGLRIRRKSSIPFWSALKVTHPVIALDYKHELLNAWQKNHEFVKAELLLFYNHPDLYHSVRAHSHVTGTIFNWAFKHSPRCIFQFLQNESQAKGISAIISIECYYNLCRIIILSVWEQFCVQAAIITNIPAILKSLRL